MPGKKHPCGHPNCATMITKGAAYCIKHRVFTPEHRANISKAVKGKYVPPEVGRKISAAMSGDGLLIRECGYCHKLFEVDKPSRKQRFCSSACGYANRKGERAFNWQSDMPRLVCRVCGNDFRVTSRTTVNNRYTCSYTCKNVWQKTRQKNKATNIEIKTEQAIQNRGWVYESQVGLCNVTVADFYLPDVGVAIFCDGDYWHSLPGKAERDQRQTKILQSAGYVVHRFLGSEIMYDIDECLDRINLSSKPHVRQLKLPIAE